MPEAKDVGKRFVKVKDQAGNVWLCSLEAMKKATEATAAELDDCVEWEGVTHTAGQIEAER